MEPIRSVERNFISNELLHAIVLIHEQTSAIGIQAFFKTAVTASQVDGDFLVTAPWSLLHPYTSGDVMRDNTTGNPRPTDFPVASFMQRSIDDTKENGLPDLSPRLTLSRNPVHHTVVGGTSSQKEDGGEAVKQLHSHGIIPFNE